MRLRLQSKQQSESKQPAIEMGMKAGAAFPVADHSVLHQHANHTRLRGVVPLPNEGAAAVARKHLLVE